MSPTTALILEWSAVALNILFTILIALEKRIGWLFGLVAALIGVFLYVAQDAWLMASLNAFYAGMGAYGWWTWGRPGGSERIISYGWRMHAALIAIGAAGGSAGGMVQPLDRIRRLCVLERGVHRARGRGFFSLAASVQGTKDDTF
ncbi:MAG: nicotinamide mononucleotide transporter [Flavobacteriales bacterium]|nr:nicotinamide mononucleotide transporter [Flavobacteriales bacterium]